MRGKGKEESRKGGEKKRRRKGRERKGRESSHPWREEGKLEMGYGKEGKKKVKGK